MPQPDHVRPRVALIPAGGRVGAALMAVAFVLDVAVHALGAHGLEPVAHLTGIAGMAIVWLAVVIDGERRIP